MELAVSMFSRMTTTHTAQIPDENEDVDASCWVPVLLLALPRPVILSVSISYLAASYKYQFPQMFESLGNWALNSVTLGLTMGHSTRISV